MNNLKVVFWDLETLPDPERFYENIPSYGMWNGRGFNGEIQSIMSFGFKILGDDKPSCVNVWDFPNWLDNPNDDSALVAYIYEMLSDADEIVTHNGRKFDLPVLNTRLMYWGYPPLPKIHHVDTKVVAKRISLYSNSLGNVAKFFELDDKMTFSNKWSMWYRIAFKKPTKKDLKNMDEYCKMDVEVLSQLYEKFRPLHGNMAVNKNILHEDQSTCPSCGSDDLLSNGYRFQGSSKYQRLQCGACGSWSRKNIKNEKVRKL